MARVTVEDCLEKVPNRFALVLMVSKRTKQLMKGAETTVAMRSNKYIVTSLREVAIGNIGFEGNMEAEHVRLQLEKDLNK